MSTGAKSSTPGDSRCRAKLIHQCAGSHQIACVEPLIEPLVTAIAYTADYFFPGSLGNGARVTDGIAGDRLYDYGPGWMEGLARAA